MAKDRPFEVRLETQDDTGHFRVVTLLAASAEEARTRCEQTEREICAFQLDPDELRHIEGIEADPKQTLAGADKGRLFAHRQTDPYVVVSVEEVK